MADRNSPIGVFDSGVGGIGTLAALRRELPRERFLFYGDTANDRQDQRKHIDHDLFPPFYIG